MSKRMSKKNAKKNVNKNVKNIHCHTQKNILFKILFQKLSFKPSDTRVYTVKYMQSLLTFVCE
jgi:hypothetical protein